MLLLLCVLLLVAGFSAASMAADPNFSKAERGRYLATAGDCVACHTAPDGKPFAGGRPIETPFGTIYSPNITPDRETGIGAWSDADLYRAMHSGIAPDGSHLYPAFPYPYFSRLTREDVSAIHAYLDSLPPVRSQRPGLRLTWPLGHRFLMAGWNWLFFDKGGRPLGDNKDAVWKRGAYLAEGLEHCGACHTPKNMAGGDENDHALEGGVIQGWFAPDITGNHQHGIGSWSQDDIVEYLKTGRNAHSGATGLMAEVVADSTSHLKDDDLKAIATYLQSLPGHEPGASERASVAAIKAGGAIFADSCSGCHKSDGKGVPHLFSPLAGSAAVQSTDTTTLTRIVLEGARTVATPQQPTTAAMPSYGWKLSDQEIADVLTYVRNSWGNEASPVSASDVEKVRETLKPPTQ